jgi:hypothetical protein
MWRFSILFYHKCIFLMGCQKPHQLLQQTVSLLMRHRSPGVSIPVEAMKVQGITDGDVAGETEFRLVAAGLSTLFGGL